MSKEDNLYKAFGDLLYAIALSDGAIHEVEVETLQLRLKHYPNAQKILAVFCDNREKEVSGSVVYQKAIAL